MFEQNNYPSRLTIGCNVCGFIRTLPLGTLAISVTAHTTPQGAETAGGDWTIDGSGV